MAAPTTTADGQLAPFLSVNDPKPRRGLRRLSLDWVLSTHLLRMALPVVLGMVTQTAINILDGVMVGHLPKAQANPGQAAIGLALPFMWLVGGFLSAVWVGTQALTSRRAGEGNPLDAGKVLTNSLVVAVISSIAVSGVAIALTPWVINSLYDDPLVVGYGIQYLQIRFVGILAMVATFSLKSFFDGIGKTKVFMTAAVIMNLLNVLLNFWLIYGFAPLGIAKMGVAGAAWASVISAFTGLGIMLAWSLTPQLRRRYRYYRARNLNSALLREILRLSLPNGAATVVVMLGFSAFYWVVGQVSDLHSPAGNPIIATANQAVVMALMPSFMTSLAFGSATAAVVSQALGANRSLLAGRYAIEGVKVWTYVMIGLGLVLMIAAEPILRAINPDPEVMAIAKTPLRMGGVIHGGVATAVILAQTLYGVGDAKFVMLIEFCLHLLVMSPAAYLFGLYLGYGLEGVFLGPGVYVALLATAMILRFRRGQWKHIRI